MLFSIVCMYCTISGNEPTRNNLHVHVCEAVVELYAENEIFHFLDNITLYNINSCCYVLTLYSDIDDLVDVKRELISIADKWKDIGLALRLKPATLNTIGRNQSDVRDRLSDVLAEWLNKAYNVQRFGQPSWQLLVGAVRDPAGGDNKALAVTIAAKYGGKGSLAENENRAIGW